MSWFRNFVQAVNKAYERRIRAASQVVEYGMGHAHGHAHGDGSMHEHRHEGNHEHVGTAEDPMTPAGATSAGSAADEGIIQNVRPGTRVGTAPSSTSSSQEASKQTIH